MWYSFAFEGAEPGQVADSEAGTVSLSTKGQPPAFQFRLVRVSIEVSLNRDARKRICNVYYKGNVTPLPQTLQTEFEVITGLVAMLTPSL